ncbi:unnamed protein product, partial [Protopolystoma xenopodis]
GKAAYASGVELLPFDSLHVSSSSAAPSSNGAFKPAKVGASYFMSYHTVLRQPSDFLDALISGRQLADDVTRIWRTRRNLSVTDGNSQMDYLEPDSVFAYR